jgi:hypothetical protein
MTEENEYVLPLDRTLPDAPLGHAGPVVGRPSGRKRIRICYLSWRLRRLEPAEGIHKPRDVMRNLAMV